MQLWRCGAVHLDYEVSLESFGVVAYLLILSGREASVFPETKYFSSCAAFFPQKLGNCTRYDYFKYKFPKHEMSAIKR